jgi:hypothetical protein
VAVTRNGAPAEPCTLMPQTEAAPEGNAAWREPRVGGAACAARPSQLGQGTLAVSGLLVGKRLLPNDAEKFCVPVSGWTRGLRCRL